MGPNPFPGLCPSRPPVGTPPLVLEHLSLLMHGEGRDCFDFGAEEGLKTQGRRGNWELGLESVTPWRVSEEGLA